MPRRKTAADAASKTAADAASKTAADAAAKTAADAAAKTVPEKYDFKVPEGAKFEGLDKLGEWCKTNGYSQAQAQAVLDREIALSKDVQAGAAKEVADAKTAWEAASRADAEIGGANYDKTLQSANAVLAKFDPKGELKAMLDATPMGNNPAVLRFFAAVAKATLPDGFVPGGKPTGSEKTPAQVLYPSMAA
jgi:hypothetical protein